MIAFAVFELMFSELSNSIFVICNVSVAEAVGNLDEKDTCVSCEGDIRSGICMNAAECRMFLYLERKFKCFKNYRSLCIHGNISFYIVQHGKAEILPMRLTACASDKFFPKWIIAVSSRYLEAIFSRPHLYEGFSSDGSQHLVQCRTLCTQKNWLVSHFYNENRKSYSEALPVF